MQSYRSRQSRGMTQKCHVKSRDDVAFCREARTCRPRKMPGRPPGSRAKAGRNTSKQPALLHDAAQYSGEGRLLGVAAHAAHAAHRAGHPADGQGADEGAAGA